MIHYHGSPITPETCAIRCYSGRHAFISWPDHRQIKLAASICQSFALDNGAFYFWKKEDPMDDWGPFYEWAGEWLTHPACDWAVIPDVIGGTEAENDALLEQWPYRMDQGVPVWHLNESVGRLIRLAKQGWPRIALGSAAEYDVRRPRACIDRLNKVLPTISIKGRPKVKLHGLRMMNSRIVTQVPFSSVDSTNVARNIGIDKKWSGAYAPSTKEGRVDVLVERIEIHQAPSTVGGSTWGHPKGTT